MLLGRVTIHGESMWPLLVPEKAYLVTGILRPRVGDVVLAETGDGLVVKRIARIERGILSLEGTVSWSSRYEVSRESVKGVLLKARWKY